MKQINYRGNTGYAVIDGILTYVEAEKVEMKANGQLVHTINGKRFRDLILYANQEQFEKGNAKRAEIISIPDKYEHREQTDEKGYTYIETAVWKMLCGAPVKSWALLDYDITNVHWIHPIVPEGFFLSRVDCIRYGQYQFKDENGDIKEQKGIGLKLRLTEEQQAFIDGEFSAVLEKAKDLGIKFLFYGEYDLLLAVDQSEVKSLHLDCRSNYDKEMPHFIGLEDLKVIKKADIWCICPYNVLCEGEN